MHRIRKWASVSLAEGDVCRLEVLLGNGDARICIYDQNREPRLIEARLSKTERRAFIIALGGRPAR